MIRPMLVTAPAMLLFAAAPARASDPVGIYALIDKVEIEPSEGQPERVRLHGVFALAQGKSGDEYAGPKRGFLYFSLPKNKQDMARKEWADLKKMARSGEGAAFGPPYHPQLTK